MPEAGMPPLLSDKTFPIGEDSGNAFAKEEPMPECLPHVQFDAGLYVFTTLRVTNNPAFIATTTTPALQTFMPNPGRSVLIPGFSIADTSNVVPTGFAGIPKTAAADFNFGTGAAPVLSLKFETDEGWGVRARWWELRQSARSLLAINNDTSAGIVPFGGSGNTNFQSPSPSPGFGVVSPDTTRLLDPFLAPGIPAPVQGDPLTSADSVANDVPATGIAQSLLANGVPGEMLMFSDRLKMDVWDLEFTKDVVLGRAGFSLSAGARYSYISQNYLATRNHLPGSFSVPLVETNTSGVNNANVEDFITVQVNKDNSIFTSAESFSGVGPTINFGFQYQIDNFLGLIAFANVRGSVLFGSQKQIAFQATQFSGLAFQTIDGDQIITNDAGVKIKDPNPADYIPTAFNAASFNQNEIRRNSTVTQWDYELGVEWGRDLGRFGFFASAAVTGQEWHGIGNATNLGGNLRLFGAKGDLGFNF
jgi:hypothetical protein